MNNVQVIGDLNWTQLRQMIIDWLNECRTKAEFETAIAKLWKSVGTKEHIIKVRKELGLKPLSKKDLETIDGKKLK